jgi:glycosyltransferase involved in cell wall biosynthesis
MIRQIVKLRGKPALVHLHIIMNEGMIALILKRICGIPYLVSEQSTHYLPEDHDPYMNRSVVTNWLIKSVLANASGVTTVSRTLSEAMKRFNGNIKPVVIPNVVDAKLFYLPAEHTHPYPFKLIHVSNFFPQKNTGDILAAFKLLQVTNPGEFSLTMAGGYPADPVEQQKWEANGVNFIGTMDQSALADKMRGSNALILYSHYETFGCVLIEAIACGLPDIVADINVIHENVKEKFNGIFAPPNDPPKLAEKIRELKLHYEQFNKERISRNAREIYSFERVGKSFHELYNTIAEV